jgi:hypothetical protein
MANDDFRAIGKVGSEFKVYNDLRRHLEEKGVDYDRLPKLSSIECPPACFVYRARGDVEQARTDYIAWLRLASETSDINYRFDMPAEVNYCRDCTPAFKKEAEAAGACQFPHVKFEVVQCMGEKEMIGVSRGEPVSPKGYWKYEDMRLAEADLPDFIRDQLADVRAGVIKEVLK